MSIINTLYERILLAFPDENKRSFKAAIIIVSAERLLPPSYICPLPPPSTREERLDFISYVLKKETGIDYSRDEVLTAHNILMGSDHIQQQLNFDCGIDKIKTYLNEYKQIQPESGFARNFKPILLFPHRTKCSLCNKQSKLIFQGAGCIMYCTTTQSCLIYKADCHECRRSYRVSSIYAMDRREIIVTSESQQANFIHFTGSLVFSKEFLISFSSQLVHNYVTFEGFASATIKTFQRLNVDNKKDITCDNLARSLQSAWLYYELTNFILMTSKSTQISFPYAMAECRTTLKGQQTARAIFIEQNINWIYHIFAVFWSNHEDLFGSCKLDYCSRVMIIDGHQKP